MVQVPDVSRSKQELAERQETARLIFASTGVHLLKEKARALASSALLLSVIPTYQCPSARPPCINDHIAFIRDSIHTRTSSPSALLSNTPLPAPMASPTSRPFHSHTNTISLSQNHPSPTQLSPLLPSGPIRLSLPHRQQPWHLRFLQKQQPTLRCPPKVLPVVRGQSPSPYYLFIGELLG